MIKYRVVETTREIVFECLSYDEAHVCLANMLDSGRTDVTVEEYEWLPQEAKRLGRDPDLH
jgi:hypothetical protein